MTRAVPELAPAPENRPPTMPDPAIDEAFMRAALALARRGLGRTAPMPSVAALVVDPSVDPPRVLGRGRTAPGGRPHAEANALIQAGAAARGATLYVTLEPCARRSQRDFGPSCSERILEAGIARVVIGAADPSPFAAGEGSARLAAAGIAVQSGFCREEAEFLTLGHRLRVSANRPFIRIKLAETADGFAASPDGEPIAITGEAARARVHRLRADVDAIVTGIDTVLADDPRLNVRLPGFGDASPLRIVLDSQGRMPADRQMLREPEGAPILIATAAPERLAARFAGAAQVDILAVPAGEGGRLDLAALLAALAARGLTRLMVEAGPVLANAFAKAGFCDEFVLLSAPHAVGRGRLAIGPDLAAWRAAAVLAEEDRLGEDRLRAYRRRL